jgi:hypothetical protein
MSLYYPHRARPLKGRAAFREISEDASPSQAGVLLSFGQQLRGGERPLRARAAALERGRYVGAEPESGFPVPRLRHPGGKVSAAESRARLKRRHGHLGGARALGAGRFSAYEKAYRDCAERVFARPEAERAADLLEMSLDHPRELVRIAAAIASLPVTTEPGRNLRVLVRGLRSADELERTLAATGLAQAYPEHPSLRRLSRGRPARPGGRPAHTLTLVHGTWAADAPWYQPGGDFFTFVRGLRPDLYGQPDFFRWSGSYSHGARVEAATRLEQWVADHGEAGLDLMGHSHGANVILKATQLGLQAGKVVLLSCPVHVDRYFPDFARLQEPVYSVRVHLDLVILADRGGQRFRHPQIREIVLPIWFDHGATHDPQVWRQNDVAQKIAL